MSTGPEGVASRARGLRRVAAEIALLADELDRLRSGEALLGVRLVDAQDWDRRRADERELADRMSGLLAEVAEARRDRGSSFATGDGVHRHRLIASLASWRDQELHHAACTIVAAMPRPAATPVLALTHAVGLTAWRALVAPLAEEACREAAERLTAGSPGGPWDEAASRLATARLRSAMANVLARSFPKPTACSIAGARRQARAMLRQDPPSTPATAWKVITKSLESHGAQGSDPPDDWPRAMADVADRARELRAMASAVDPPATWRMATPLAPFDPALHAVLPGSARSGHVASTLVPGLWSGGEWIDVPLVTLEPEE